MTRLSTEVGKHQLLKQRILELEPDVDEVTLADTLEGLTDLNDIIFAVSRGIVVDEAHVDGLRLYLKDLQERVSRLESRARSRREAVRDAMVEAGLKQLVAPDLTLSIRSSSPGLVVSDESEISEHYFEPRPPKLNRMAVLNDLRRGASVPGTFLSNAAPVLAVRTK